ncbi:MAG TPA: YIP1 family protein [Myxococcales bacterium]
MLARCPNCRNTFSTSLTGRQECPVCHKPLIVPEAAPPPEAEMVREPSGTPWERRAELGSWTAWVETMREALFDPTKLFSAVRMDRGSAQLGFAVLTTSAASIVGQLLGRVMSGNQQAMLERMLERVPPDSPMLPLLRSMVAGQGSGLRFVLLLLLSPLFAAVFVYLNAAVTHAFAAILGQSKRGFPATFAACAYGCAPLALAAIPACGSLIGIVWLVVLTGIGMKIVHGIGSSAAAASVLLPYGACCCLSLALSALGVAAASRVMGQ